MKIRVVEIKQRGETVYHVQTKGLLFWWSETELVPDIDNSIRYDPIVFYSPEEAYNYIEDNFIDRKKKQKIIATLTV